MSICLKFIRHQVHYASSLFGIKQFAYSLSHPNCTPKMRTQTASYPIPSQSASPQSATDNKSQSRLAFGGRQPIFNDVKSKINPPKYQSKETF